MNVVYRYRVKSLIGLLNQQSRAVNFVWNFCNDTQRHALRWRKIWPTAYDIEKLTAGSNKELGIHSGVINQICQQYVQSRRQFKRPYLRYRGKKSLGWIPLKGRDLKREGDSFRFAGNTFRVFNSRPLPEGKIKDGTNFSRDRRGNWFLNIVIDIADAPRREILNGVGIDLGLKNFATLSTGERIINPRHLRQLEEALAKAQRAGRKRQVLNIHARIKNTRSDFLHKLSHRIVQEFDYVAIGNVSASKLAKTSMAKSVLDASWSSFRQMLAHKAVRHGAWYEEIDERFTSQACSCCGSIPPSSPKGRAALGIRHWVCSACGSVHDRDVNAAQNILARSGHRSPVEGISAVVG
ncbi:transposase [Burkholderia cenocepacia]|uniref:RNA-guided endonuclease InsQ/TnpB family protein n=1 Tax=Burkholderia cenocepacia TaxID=95486 RepID=UPI000F687162|nr:RNA-guided endonuclease TnpB family protein [Burkholderia cenocepacia]RSB84922.1 transposase [Burkholderia cenocepacia]